MFSRNGLCGASCVWVVHWKSGAKSVIYDCLDIDGCVCEFVCKRVCPRSEPDSAINTEIGGRIVHGKTGAALHGDTTAPGAAEHGSFNRIDQVAPMCTPSNTRFLGLTRFCHRNGVLIGLTVSAGIIRVTNTRTDRQTYTSEPCKTLTRLRCRLDVNSGGPRNHVTGTRGRHMANVIELLFVRQIALHPYQRPVYMHPVLAMMRPNINGN